MNALKAIGLFFYFGFAAIGTLLAVHLLVVVSDALWRAVGG